MAPLFEFSQESSFLMNKGQTRGMIAITIGFILIVIAGITLSFLVVDRLSGSQTLVVAVLIFLFVSPIFAYGVYTYARSTEEEAYATNEEMEKPRQLLDILREQEHGDVIELANQLETSPSELKAYIQDLSQLSLFSGIADWENDVIAMVEPMVIESIENCKTCQNPIEISGNITICQHCRTEYYKL